MIDFNMIDSYELFSDFLNVNKWSVIEFAV